MEIEAGPITGQETADAGSPPAALIGFYRAFNARDLDGLAANWCAGDAPSMDNPVGGIRRGWPSIAEGYGRLFNSPARVEVAFCDYSSQGDAEHHLFVGRECGWCIVGEERLALRIRTSRLFVRRGDAWRQLHHHGSIEEPELLAAYQTAIFGRALDAPL